jgi:hypothetical protein
LWSVLQRAAVRLMCLLARALPLQSGAPFLLLLLLPVQTWLRLLLLLLQGGMCLLQHVHDRCKSDSTCTAHTATV